MHRAGSNGTTVLHNSSLPNGTWKEGEPTTDCATSPSRQVDAVPARNSGPAEARVLKDEAAT